jgi:hypothetical protein
VSRSLRAPRRAAALLLAVSGLALSGCGVTQVAEPIASQSALRTPAAGDGGPGLPATPPSSSPTLTPTPGGTNDTNATAHDFALIRASLAARSKAVLQSDEGAFLATIDPEDPTFRAHEAVVYQNLQKLPVGSMSYEASGFGVTPAKVPGTDLVLAPEVTEHVLLQGTDYQPVGISVNMTFVQRRGTWYLGADTTVANSASDFNASERPWEGGPIAVVQTGPLLVVADASPAGTATSLSDIVRTDIADDAAVLQIPAESRLLVDVTSSGNVTKFANNEEAGGVTYGVDASKDFQDTGLAGWRIKINPQDLKYLSEDPSLLKHELTHYLLRQYNGRVPLWLSEGIAEYVGHQPEGLPSEGMTQQSYDRLLARPHELIGSGLFGDDPETDYPLAMAIVTYLVDQGGITKVITLMKTFAAYGDAVYEDQHTAQALQQVYGLTPLQVANGAFALLAALH